MENNDARLTEDQMVAIKLTEESAKQLCEGGDLDQLGANIKKYLLEGNGTIPEAVQELNLVEEIAPTATVQTIENIIRRFVSTSFTQDEKAIVKKVAKTKIRQRMAQTNIEKHEEINRGKKSETKRKKTAKNMHERMTEMTEEEKRTLQQQAVQASRQKFIEAGGFDHSNTEQVHTFLEACRNITHTTNNRLNGKPDFNRIAELMKTKLSIDRPRRYWVSIYHKFKNLNEQ